MVLFLKKILTILSVTTGLLTGSVLAGELATSVDPADLASKKHTSLDLYLTAEEAHKYITADPSILFIDVRTRAEVNYVGWADEVDANIPFMFLEEGYILNDKGSAYREVDNDNFGFEIDDLAEAAGGGEETIIVLICRSGNRSAKAASILADYGYTQVYSVVDGFEGEKDKITKHRTVNGWKNAGLPWHYGLDAEKVYHQPES